MGKILDAIEKIAKEKREAGKELEMTSFRKDRIRDLERKYERNELDKNEALAELEKEFGYHLDKGDYEKVERNIR